ncbi:MAG: peroxiredoxin [Polaribacter sp.]|jgi:peroxiredoxin
MSLTESKMIPLGTKAPDFKLKDTVSGKEMSLSDIPSENARVIMFICNHCPYVLHITEEIAKLAKDYKKKGVGFLAISSNDVENYPVDSPENMKAFAKDEKFNFPYLYDETQEVAKAYDAACTPDFYIFDKKDKLAYRGRLDDSRPNSGIPVTGAELRAALDTVLNREKVSATQYPSMGCNIKWK